MLSRFRLWLREGLQCANSPYKPVEAMNDRATAFDSVLNYEPNRPQFVNPGAILKALFRQLRCRYPIVRYEKPS